MGLFKVKISAIINMGIVDKSTTINRYGPAHYKREVVPVEAIFQRVLIVIVADFIIKYARKLYIKLSESKETS